MMAVPSIVPNVVTGPRAAGAEVFPASVAAPRYPAAARVDLRRTMFLQFHKIGDSLIFAPLLEAVKRADPTHQVFVVASPQATEVLQNNPYVDEIITTPLVPYCSRTDLARAIPLCIRQALRWRATTAFCDVVNSNPLMAVLLRTLPVRHKILGQAVRYQRWLCGGFVHANADVRVDRAAEGTVRGYNLAILDHIGCPRSDGRVRVYPSDAERARVHAFMRGLGLDPTRRTIGFAPYSKTQSTAWPTAHAVAFASAASERYNVVVFGGRDEAERWRRDAGALASAAHVFPAFGLNLRESQVAMGLTDVVVALNTGVSHLFHTLDVPLVRINADMQPAQLWGYDGEPRYLPVRHPVPCGPCFSGVCRVAGHPCMSGITPAIVLDRVHDALAVGPRPAAA